MGLALVVTWRTGVAVISITKAIAWPRIVGRARHWAPLPGPATRNVEHHRCAMATGHAGGADRVVSESERHGQRHRGREVPVAIAAHRDQGVAVYGHVHLLVGAKPGAVQVCLTAGRAGGWVDRQ